MEIKVDQGSEEWFNLRTGKITASIIPKLMPTKTQKIDKWNDTQLSILRQIASERLTGVREEVYTNQYMQWGIDNEDSAREALSSSIGIIIRESGFWQMSEYVGASPDGIIGFNEAVCELKCPTPKQHLRYFLDMKEWIKDYGYQIKFQMYVSGIKQGYAASFDPRYPESKRLAYVEMSLSDGDVDLFDNRIGNAVQLIRKWCGTESIEVDLNGTA